MEELRDNEENISDINYCSKDGDFEGEDDKKEGNCQKNSSFSLGKIINKSLGKGKTAQIKFGEIIENVLKKK